MFVDFLNAPCIKLASCDVRMGRIITTAVPRPWMNGQSGRQLGRLGTRQYRVVQRDCDQNHEFHDDQAKWSEIRLPISIIAGLSKYAQTA